MKACNAAASRFGDVFECALTRIAIENRAVAEMDVGVEAVDFREHVPVHNEQVLPAVVIEIEERAAPTHEASVVAKTGGECHVVKLAIAAVVVQRFMLVGEISA